MLLGMDISEIRYANTRLLVKQIGSITGFAERLGKSQGQVSHFAGENPIKNIGNKIAREIEEAFDLERGWLDVQQTEKKVKKVKAFEIRGVDGDDGLDGETDALVSVVTAELSAGDGQTVEFVETKYRLPYQIEWLRSVGVRKPEDVHVMVARGESMEPNVSSGDKMLIHLRNNRIESGGVYAIMLDGECRIKRLFRVADGIRIVSDNADKLKYPDDLVTPENAERLIIIGRAIHRQTSKGL